MSFPPQWFHDPSDIFPGDFYCYVLMSIDEDCMITVHDVVRASEPVSEEYLQQRKDKVLASSEN